VHTESWWGFLRDADHLEDPDITLKWDMGTWTRLIWLRIGTGGGLLQIQ
jgi:hypothetical protein